MTAQTASGLDDQNPWPGLGEFGEFDKDFFNGRGLETAHLLRLVNDAPLTVLFGLSGLGKTSLLLAGLAPRLRAQNKLPVYVHLRLDPHDAQQLIEQAFSKFREELEKQEVDHPAVQPGESLWEYLHRSELELWSKTNQLLTPVFIFDQFEEMFTIGGVNADAVERFRDDLADLVENLVPTVVAEQHEQDDSDVSLLDLQARRSKVVLSFREDFLADTENWREAIPSLSRNRLRLETMDGDQAFEAVKKTGDRLVDSDTALAIVRWVAAARAKLGGKDRAGDAVPNGETSDLSQLKIEPALLSLICTKLNERRKLAQKPTIDQSLLSGNANEIVKEFYEESVSKLPRARRFVEEELITEGGFRNTFPYDDAITHNYLSPEQLEELVKRRLLRKEPHLGTDRIELIHDRLTDVVRESRDARRKAEEEARKREEEANQKARKLRRRLWIAALGVLFILGISVLYYFIRETHLRDADAKHKDALRIALQGGAFDLALNELSDALSEFETWRGEQSAIIRVRVDQGKIYALSNKNDLAEQGLNRARKDAEGEPALRAEEAVALESIASFHEGLGHVETAIAEYDSAIREYEAIGDFASVARILEGKANREEKEQEFELANADYRHALKDYQISKDTIGMTRTSEATKRTAIWGYLVDLNSGRVSYTHGSRYTIGRDVLEEGLKNDLSFPNRVVSRHHLEIAEKGPLIEDYRSLNGSTIDAEWLPYAQPQSLQDGDIITLANTEVLQFTKTKPEPPNVPSNPWAIFIDGTSKRASYLTETLYSVMVTSSGLTVQKGGDPSAVLKIPRPENNKAPEVISADDRWAVCVQGKVGDYKFPQAYLKPDQMNYLFDYPARLVEKKKSTGSERAVKKPSGEKQIECEGPSFQIVPLFAQEEPR